MVDDGDHPYGRKRSIDIDIVCCKMEGEKRFVGREDALSNLWTKGGYLSF